MRDVPNKPDINGGLEESVCFCIAVAARSSRCFDVASDGGHSRYNSRKVLQGFLRFRFSLR